MVGGGGNKDRHAARISPPKLDVIQDLDLYYIRQLAHNNKVTRRTARGLRAARDGLIGVPRSAFGQRWPLSPGRNVSVVGLRQGFGRLGVKNGSSVTR